MAPMILRSFLLFSFVCFYSGLDDVVKGLECQSNPNNPARVWYTLNVRPPVRHESNSNLTIKRESGKLVYTSIQAAIDSIPDGNDKWIQIFVQIGSYWEKINLNKSCILLEGRYAQKTLIEFNAHQNTLESATFTSVAENFVAKHITFVAVAAMIHGDKSAFYSCGFFGVQDTLWDSQGRHYFKNCYIDGAVDFIMGNGQSIYDECIIRVLGNSISASGGVGYITAQSRSSDEDPSGFVFKGGVVEGNGKAWLGRAWGSHSRVIFNGTYFNDIIVPEGWSPWEFENDPVKHFTYTDQNSEGPGNDTSRRHFNTSLTDQQMQQFTDLSYIDAEGWISNHP
ncbi:probable pectinesterase 55 [Papaver somniferum]|uniref:probable pectinesterase 55 n=1 Tax=Papaver somniferum TaxID=3469 RepID=UPI000E6F75E7|nr:probable pectinesterase 55 [Papaver somniferum]